MFADDLLFRQIVDGTMSDNDLRYEYLMVINVIYANFVKILYSIFPLQPWYDLVLLLLSIAASFVIISILVRFTKGVKNLRYITILLLLTLPVFFLKVQFNLVSGILNLSVALVLLYYVIHGINDKCKLVAAFLYVYLASVFGSLLRFHNFYFFFLCAGLLVVIFLRDKIKLHKILHLVPLFILIFITQIWAYKYDQNYYKQGTKNIEEHNKLNFAIMDTNSFPTSDQLTRIQESLANDSKWTIEDFMLLRTGFYYDMSIFPEDKARDLYNRTKIYLTKKSFSVEYIKTNANYTFKLLAPNLVLLCLIGYFLYGLNGFYVGLRIYMTIFTLFFMGGFAFKEIPFRIGYPIIIFSYILLFITDVSQHRKFSVILHKIAGTAIIIILLSAIVGHMYTNYKKSLLLVKIRSELSNLDSSKIYFHHAFPDGFDTYEMPYKPFLPNTSSNIKFLSWTYLSPAFQDFLKKEKIYNFERDICIESDKVRLLFSKNYANLIFPYLKESIKTHYNMVVDFGVEDSLSGINMNIYQCKILSRTNKTLKRQANSNSKIKY